jgi:archaellum component FlaG (FlaF/FlaG flagellin family)
VGGRSFVLGTTVVESLRAVGRDLQGFESADVGVKRAPKVEGLLDLVMQPSRPKAGEAYAVQLFLKNEGKKAIEVDEMKVSMIVDGKWSTRPLPAKVKQVPPKQRVLLEELPGIWKGGVNDWAVEAVVTSKNQDVYRNRLTWK